MASLTNAGVAKCPTANYIWLYIYISIYIERERERERRKETIRETYLIAIFSIDENLHDIYSHHKYMLEAIDILN